MIKLKERSTNWSQERWTKAILKAMGDRSQAKFAKDCKITTVTVSNWINKNQGQPTYESVFKVANGSRQYISENELIIAAGYPPLKLDSTSRKTLANDIIKILVEFGEIDESDTISLDKRQRIMDIIELAFAINRK